MKLKKREFAVVLALVLALSLWALWPKAEGNTVTVTVDGDTVLTLDLNEDGEYPLEGYNGFLLKVIVDGGQVWVEDSTCPDLICQNHAPIFKSGAQIVCLPARIVVSVTGEEAQIDAVAG